jgi:hypothetical protein
VVEVVDWVGAIEVGDEVHTDMTTGESNNADLSVQKTHQRTEHHCPQEYPPQRIGSLSWHHSIRVHPLQCCSNSPTWTRTRWTES